MQVKANVNAVSFLLTDAQATMGAAADQSENGLDFASFLAKPSDTVEASVADTAVRKETKQSDERRDTLNVADNRKNESEKMDTVKTESAQTVKEETDVNSLQGTVAVISEDNELVPEDEEWIVELLGNMFGLVQDSFQLPLKELPEKLEELGMELTDLLSSEGMKEFFLDMNGADRSDLIVNEELNEELTMLLTEVHAVYEQCEVEETEVVQRITNEEMTQVLEDTTAVLEDTAQIPKDMPKKGLDGSESQQREVQTETTTEPEVVVEQHSTQGKMTKENSSDQRENLFEEAKPQDEKELQRQPVSNRQEHFTNPILEGIKEAVDQADLTGLEQQPVQGADVVQQIVEQVRVNLNRVTTSMELQLYPEHLGKIQIHVVSKDGIMTARIVAETEAARQAIEGGLANLKEAMDGQDLKVEAIEVMVSTTGFERGEEEANSFEQEKMTKGKRRLDLSETEEETEEENAELEKMKQVGSSVSYTA